MVQARDQMRAAPAMPARDDGAAKSLQATASPKVTVYAGGAVAEVPVTPMRFKRIVNRKRGLSKVISGYADAAAKASQTGKIFVMTYEVHPNGKIEVVRTLPETRGEAAGAAGNGGLDAAIVRAKARGATKVADILRGADMLSAREFGPLIGTSHATVHAKRKGHEVLGLEGAVRGVKYPRWQVTDVGLPLPGLPKLFEVLGDQPWTIYRFLRAAHAELGGKTALDVLKAGRVDAVVEVAENQAAGAYT